MAEQIEGNRHKLMRIGLVLLGISNLVVGSWAMFAPASWYDDFPGRELHWVAAFGPYNAHLIQDVGGAYLAFAALFFWAAYVSRRTAIFAALVGYLVFQLPHLLIHIFVRAQLSTTGYIGTVTSLVFGVGLAVIVLMLARTAKE